MWSYISDAAPNALALDDILSGDFVLPRDSEGNFLCIYKCCDAPIRVGESSADFNEHLKHHSEASDVLLTCMVKQRVKGAEGETKNEETSEEKGVSFRPAGASGGADDYKLFSPRSAEGGGDKGKASGQWASTSSPGYSFHHNVLNKHSSKSGSRSALYDGPSPSRKRKRPTKSKAASRMPRRVSKDSMLCVLTFGSGAEAETYEVELLTNGRYKCLTMGCGATITPNNIRKHVAVHDRDIRGEDIEAPSKRSRGSDTSSDDGQVRVFMCNRCGERIVGGSSFRSHMSHCMRGVGVDVLGNPIERTPDGRWICAFPGCGRLIGGNIANFHAHQSAHMRRDGEGANAPQSPTPAGLPYGQYNPVLANPWARGFGAPAAAPTPPAFDTRTPPVCPFVGCGNVLPSDPSLLRNHLATHFRMGHHVPAHLQFGLGYGFPGQQQQMHAHAAAVARAGIGGGVMEPSAAALAAAAASMNAPTISPIRSQPTKPTPTKHASKHAGTHAGEGEATPVVKPIATTTTSVDVKPAKSASDVRSGDESDSLTPESGTFDNEGGSTDSGNTPRSSGAAAFAAAKAQDDGERSSSDDEAAASLLSLAGQG